MICMNYICICYSAITYKENTNRQTCLSKFINLKFEELFEFWLKNVKIITPQCVCDSDIKHKGPLMFVSARK